MNLLPGNRYAAVFDLGLRKAGVNVDSIPIAYAILALASEQRDRNTLAYRTAEKRGINLGGLDHLKGES